MHYSIRVAAPLAVALCLSLAGCGEKGPELPKCYPVSGKVLVDGAPAVRALVGFHPKAPQFNGEKYGGSTFTDDDGVFRMTTFSAGDGVPAGEYAVTIVANWISKGGQDVGVPDLLGGEYATPEVSTLKVTVQEEPLDLKPFELTKSADEAEPVETDEMGLDDTGEAGN